MLYSIDRIEGDIAVLVDEEGNSIPMPRAALPTGVRVGAMLRRNGEIFILTPDEEEKRRRRVLELQQRLRGGSQK